METLRRKESGTVNSADRFNETCEAMIQLGRISDLLRNVDAPRYIVDRIEGIECKLLEFCNDIESLMSDTEQQEPCRYCGGSCPNDEDHACDGYLGDIDNLYNSTQAITRGFQ